MTTKVWTLLLLLGVLACSSINAQSKIGFNQVLTHLGNFQSTNGGFRNAQGIETVGATSSALLLSSLYGLNAKINTVEAIKFIASLENKDGGYGAFVGAPSDIESTRNALISLVRLGAKTANPDSTAAYLKSQVDSTGLFGGSIRASALALQSFELLGQKIPTDLASGVKAFLKGESSFGEAVSDIYYSVLASSLVGFEVPADKVATTLLELQGPQGLFFIDNTKAAISAESTADAFLALNILGAKYVDSANFATLKAATRYLPLDIEQAADIHVALAVTKAFRDNFLIATAASPVIVEGSEAIPAIALAAKESGVPHSGFDVSSKHTFSGKTATKSKLTWNQEVQAYAGAPLPSAGNFGPFESVYTFSTVVPGVGPLSFDVADTKQVGYGIVVTPKATIELSGREVKENEQVTVGTDFAFDVVLSTSTNDKLVSGDFVATFSVLDSSNVIIYQTTVDGSSNKDVLAFTYKLASADVPAGKLSFKFDVATKAGVVHTTHIVSYSLAIAMVASNIVFEQKANTYKIGDTVKFTFEPATFPDLRTPQPLSTKDAKGADAAASRHFFLDVRSPQGALIRSVEGTPSKSSQYSFSLTVEPVFASLGLNALTFHYKPANGEDIVLQNFDSSVGELYEDINVLNYTVKGDLALVEVTEKPTVTDLVYGDSVVYNFRVKDTVSGKYLTASPDSTANVYLELLNEKAGRTVASVSVPAISVKDQIIANWTINPNAHTGSGVLTLTVVDADGKKIDLKDTVKQTVTIGGEITSDSHTTSTNSLDTTFTTFVVDLGLFCREKPLKGAQLRANVFYEDSTTPLTTLPVATSPLGRYTVSYSAPHREARSGTYRFEFVREVDRLAALERQQTKDKEARKKGEEVQEEEVKVDSLVTVKIVHTAPRFTQLPVKAEFIALVLFGGIVIWLINKRSNLK